MKEYEKLWLYKWEENPLNWFEREENLHGDVYGRFRPIKKPRVKLRFGYLSPLLK